MRMYDIIEKQRDRELLSHEEISFVVNGYTAGEIPDYQMSALLMAICINGLDAQQTAWLTMAMAQSGDMVDLSSLPGVKVDKHSTGGVGDKTTLIAGPIAAACGVTVAKMSGRGLGHTGGTVDKLEAIPGYQTAIDRERFFEIVRQNGLSVIGQSGNLAPADKKIYALRDVTGTVESIPLIASSIMSKKIAAGADAILLDVKTGSGAFMHTLEDSIRLAQAMVEIGEHVGRKTTALITDMDLPLGSAIGNALEVAEAVETLRGNGPEDLTELCITLAAQMIYLAGKGKLSECEAMARHAIEDGSALSCLKRMVFMHGGDAALLEDPDLFEVSPLVKNVYATQSGYIASMDTKAVGIASVELGAGRLTKEETIDYGAGIMLIKKTGDRVEKGDLIARFYTASEEKFTQAEHTFLQAIGYGQMPPELKPLVFARVDANGVLRY